MFMCQSLLETLTFIFVFKGLRPIEKNQSIRGKILNWKSQLSYTFHSFKERLFDLTGFF